MIIINAKNVMKFAKSARINFKFKTRSYKIIYLFLLILIIVMLQKKAVHNVIKINFYQNRANVIVKIVYIYL
jgi:hypothetical protein